MRLHAASTPHRRPNLNTSTPPHSPPPYASHTSHLHTCAQVTKCSSGLQINPGSATGAYSTFSNTVVPSFVLLDLDGSKVWEEGRGGRVMTKGGRGAWVGAWMGARWVGEGGREGHGQGQSMQRYGHSPPSLGHREAECC